MTTTTTSAPILTPGPGQQLGAFGQICDITTSSSVCVDPTIDTAIVAGGNMQCEGEYDCCNCQSIQCGNEQGGGCSRFSAGTQGAFGVGDITIFGSNYHGAIIDCFGYEGCSYTDIKATNVGMVRASNDMSLANAKIIIENPLPGFSLDCSGGIGGCAALNIELKISGPPPGYECNPNIPIHLIQFSQIKCGTQESCKDMQFTFINEGCNPVTIDSLDCIESDSCNGANFNFIGDITISKCGFKGAANGVRGVDKCFEHLETLLCPDATSCSNAVRTLNNPVNGFVLNCGNGHSCEGLQLTININENTMEPIQYLDLFKFSGELSGANTIITINNFQKDVEVRINKIECTSAQACENMTIYLGNYVSIGEIVCASNGCNGCMVKRTFNKQIVSCYQN
eukprot:158326_1